MLALLLGGQAVAQPGIPTAQLKTTIEEIIGTLTKDDLETGQKRLSIRQLINSRFDFEAMSQLTLAINWRRANADQRQRFIELFSRLLEGAYMGRIEQYTNEKVEFLDERIKNNKALVNTFIVTSTVEIPIDYKLVKKGNDWRVYDVVIEEVSLISNYRNTYRDVVRRDGIDGLLKQMQQKLDELQQEMDVARQDAA
jgi:phospholipid transport system substrate-binding protein